MDAPPWREINIKVIEARDYKKLGATGVVGGFTPNGHLMCNFFIESVELPAELKHIVAEDGNLVPAQANQEPTNIHTLVRELQVGLLLSPQLVHSIAEWFVAQSTALRKIQAEQESAEKGIGG